MTEEEFILKRHELARAYHLSAVEAFRGIGAALKIMENLVFENGDIIPDKTLAEYMQRHRHLAFGCIGEAMDSLLNESNLLASPSRLKLYKDEQSAANARLRDAVQEIRQTIRELHEIVYPEDEEDEEDEEEQENGVAKRTINIPSLNEFCGNLEALQYMVVDQIFRDTDEIAKAYLQLKDKDLLLIAIHEWHRAVEDGEIDIFRSRGVKKLLQAARHDLT